MKNRTYREAMMGIVTVLLAGSSSAQQVMARLQTDKVPGNGSMQPVMAVTLTGKEVTTDAVSALAAHQKTTWLTLKDAVLTKELSECLARLPDLERLVLDRVELPQGDLPMLNTLTNLTTLFVMESVIREELPRRVKSLPKLKVLSFRNCLASDQTFASLGELTQLESLGLGGTGVTDNSVSAICRLGSLKRLWLDRTAVTWKGVEHLLGMQNLEFLGIWGSPAADQYRALSSETQPDAGGIDIRTVEPPARPLPPSMIRVALTSDTK